MKVVCCIFLNGINHKAIFLLCLFLAAILSITPKCCTHVLVQCFPNFNLRSFHRLQQLSVVSNKPQFSILFIEWQKMAQNNCSKDLVHEKTFWLFPIWTDY